MIGELKEMQDWLRAATAGWRFLFSKTHRRRVIEGWRAEAWYYAAFDVGCGLAGIALTLAVFIGLGAWILKK